MRRFSGVLFFSCWGNLLPDSERHINLTQSQVETKSKFMDSLPREKR